MSRPTRYDILFEPIDIGPVRARNRFYQVPHCDGMGYRDPSASAGMRGVKAEGGWAVVCTQQCEFDYVADITPYIELHLWDDSDIPVLSKIADNIHRHGALAGVELVQNGMNAPGHYSREIPQGPMNIPVLSANGDPVQARAMTKRDISRLRRLHRAAAIRAKRAGFDIVYVYAGHSLSTLHHFLSPLYNQRTDEYGGSVTNRARLLREILEDTRDAVGDTCAVAVRISTSEMIGLNGLTTEMVRETVAQLAELPDLWDFAMGEWSDDSITSRFGDEGSQESYVAGLKELTTKPVVGVGRFTSPDAMVSQIKRGILDFIGAARPSIADPFLPKKIEDGRFEDIRECIGCNICVSSDMLSVPIRCTQNPTMGEEWRKGWHPEKIAPKKSDKEVLVVGAGPAGLECVRALGERGYKVTVSEAREEVGGRVSDESKLPGLSAWGRVRDYRVGQIKEMPNVDVFCKSHLSAEDILSFGIGEVVIATGSSWRKDGVARFHLQPIPISEHATVWSPNDIFSGAEMSGDILLYDDDHYYLGGVLAEYLVGKGCRVTLVTPASDVSAWTFNTLERDRIWKRILGLGISVETRKALSSVEANSVKMVCVHSGEEKELACDGVMMVTARLPENSLLCNLEDRREEWGSAGISSVCAIGDALAPGVIAAAVYSGHRFARELDESDRGDDVPFRREIAAILPD